VDRPGSVLGKVPCGEGGCGQACGGGVEVPGLVGDVSQYFGAGNGLGQFGTRVAYPGSECGLELFVWCAG